MKLFSYKPNKNEYTPDMMPHTRKEVFFDVLKLQWKSFLWLGALVLASALPLIICYVLEQVYSSMILDQVQGLENGVEYMAAINKINGVSNIFAFIKIPFCALLGVIIAGIARIIRQYAYEECVHFSFDFVEGVKQNGKQMVLLFALYSFIGAISHFAYGLSILTDGAMTFISMMPMILFVFIFTPIAAVMLVLIPVYSNTFSRNFKWAMYVFGKKPLKIMLACACCALPFALSIIPNFNIALMGMAIAIFLIPFVMLAFFLCLYNILDDLINKDNYPDIVGKGTF